MEAMTVRQAATIPASSFDAKYFDSFLAFIDRGEKTTQTYITNLRQFVAWLNYEGITQPTRADIITYRDYLLTEHDAIQLAPGTAAGFEYRTDNAGNRYKVTCRPNTARAYLRSVCQFFKWAAASGLYPDIAANIHITKTDNRQHRKQALDPAAVVKIEQTITATAQQRIEAAAEQGKDTAGRIDRATEQGKRLYALYLLTVTAGLRTIELSRANVKDLELQNGNAFIYVWGKGHTEADTKQPLAPEVYAAIKNYLQSRADKPTGNSPLFTATGNRSGGKRLAARTISQMLKGAMKEAGFDSERLTAHSLRHTAGTAAMIQSNNLFTTQQYMRHADPATTERYLHVTQEAQEIQLAQDIFDYYHGTDGAATKRQQLAAMIESMTPAALGRLADIAAAMAN